MQCRGLSLNATPKPMEEDECVGMAPLRLLAVFPAPSVAVLPAVGSKAKQLCSVRQPREGVQVAEPLGAVNLDKM